MEDRAGTPRAAGAHANWATPVGATTHPDFKPGAEPWSEPAEESSAAAGSVRRSTLWALVLLIGASVILVGMWMFRNAAVERDLAALARHASLPAFRKAEPATPPVVAAVEPAIKPGKEVAEQPTSDTATAPASGTGQSGESGSGPEAPAPRAQGIVTAPIPSPSRKQFAPSGKAGAGSSANTFSNAPQRSREGRRLPITRDLYSQVFRRCPPPGAYGALECRKHICNGAEGKGPACRHINKLKL